MAAPRKISPAVRALNTLAEWLNKGENLRTLLGVVCILAGAATLASGIKSRERREAAYKGLTTYGVQAAAMSNTMIAAGLIGVSAGLFVIRTRRRDQGR